MVDLAQKSDEAILAVVAPMMDNLMDASTAIDHERHVRDFTARMKRIVTKEYLQRVCETYQREKGYFGSRVPVAIFRRPDSLIVTWKQSFTKQPGEFLAELLLVQEDNKYLIDHVSIL
jgi:hypothetical protein